jgi:selenocysteine lyase/cysteine desulfurase
VDATAIATRAQGGTGSRSEYEEQPEHLPDRFESGTPNGVGIAGMGAGVRWVLARGVESIRSNSILQSDWIARALNAMADGVKVHGPGVEARKEERIPVFSFTVDGKSVSEIGLRLDEDHDILSRVGLHCAPAAHRTLGTFPKGTVRLAPGPFTTQEEIRTAMEALTKVLFS